MKKKIIEVSNLVKRYKKNGTFALNGINLSIRKGSIFGLLGPNGAGKSTFINILAGLVNKTSGTVKVFDLDLDKEPKTIRGNLGIVPQEINIDPFFTPMEVMENQAGMYGIRKNRRKSSEILENLNLKDKANAYSRSLSGGMKRRLMVAKAMVHNPPIIILDEPTAGVDVELRNKLWDYIRKLNKAGTTIILTTHYLKEAEILCDELAVIDNGEVIACDKKNNLLSLLDYKRLILEFYNDDFKIPQKLKKYCIKINRNSVVLKFNKNEISVTDLIKKFEGVKNKIKDISTKETDLEEIFINLLKK